MSFAKNFVNLVMCDVDDPLFLFFLSILTSDASIDFFRIKLVVYRI